MTIQKSCRKAHVVGAVWKPEERLESIIKIALGHLPQFDAKDLRMKYATLAYAGLEPSMFEAGEVCLCAYVFNERTGHGGFWRSRAFLKSEIDEMMPLLEAMSGHVGKTVEASICQRVTSRGTLCHDIQFGIEQLCG